MCRVRRDSRNSPHQHANQSRIALVVICLLVSLSVQLLLPFLVRFSTKTVCESTSLVSVLSELVECPTQNKFYDAPMLDERGGKRTSREEKHELVSYMLDPLAELWPYDETTLIETSELSTLICEQLDERRLLSTRDPARESEALTAVTAAQNALKRGQSERARKLIEHAYALAPDHPDVLVEFGRVLEHDNPVEADRLYSHALSLDAHHESALVLRLRTEPLVADLDRRFLASIHQRRRAFTGIAKSGVMAAELRRTLREAYYDHVYHSLALEGNTLTLFQMRAILESRTAIGGKSLVEQQEVIGMDAALRFLNRTLFKLGRLEVEDILELHRRVLGFVDPLAAGQFRRTQVYVGSFVPVAASRVHDDMRDLVNWLNEERSLDPIELAALLHYKFVYIHPFVDGNGRTARLLMNLVLMQAGFPPVALPVSLRADYYAALRSGNAGDLRPFVRFVARQAEATLSNYLSAVVACDSNSAENSGDSSAAVTPATIS